MANKKVLEVVITGNPAGAKKAFAETESAASKMSSGIKGALAGVAAAGFLGKAFGEAQEAQKAAAQTAAAIKSTGAAAGISADQVADLANEISKTTGIDDELIQSAENLLLTFTNIKAGGPDQVFERTTQAAVDMAAALGTDATSAAMMLGKALNDPSAGLAKLTRAGVTFTEQQKAQIKSMQEAGDVAGAQGVILDELAREFGGSAAAQATAADKARVAFDNMAESVGTALVPATETAANAVTGLANAFSSQPQLLQQVELGAAAAALGWLKFGDSIKSAATFIGATTTKVLELVAVEGTATTATTAFKTALLGVGSAAAVVLPTALALGVHYREAGRAADEASKMFGGGEGLVDQLQKLHDAELTPGHTIAELKAYADLGRKATDELLRTGTAVEILDAWNKGITEGASAMQVAVAVASANKNANDLLTGSETALTSAIQGRSEAQKSAVQIATDAASANSSLISSTMSLADAQQAVRDNEADAAGTSQRIADIREQAAEQAEQSAASIAAAARGVEDAERGVEDAVRARADAVRAAVDAQQTLDDLNAKAITLQAALTQAYKDGEQALKSLALAQKGDEISVRDAQRALQDAQDAARTTIDDPRTTKDERAEAADRVLQQQIRLEEAQARAKQSTEELNAAQAAGVEGSKPVVAAQQAIADNADAIANAQQVVVDANQRVEDADRRVADAHRAVGDAAAALAKAESDAKDQRAKTAKEIQKIQDEAIKKSGAVKLAAVDAAIAWATAAEKAGLPAQAIVDGLTGLATSVLPQIGEQLGTIIRDIQNASLTQSFTDYGNSIFPGAIGNGSAPRSAPTPIRSGKAGITIGAVHLTTTDSTRQALDELSWRVPQMVGG